MNSYQKRTFMKRGPFDVDLTRIWIKASIKELKGKGLRLLPGIFNILLLRRLQ